MSSWPPSSCSVLSELLARQAMAYPDLPVSPAMSQPTPFLPVGPNRYLFMGLVQSRNLVISYLIPSDPVRSYQILCNYPPLILSNPAQYCSVLLSLVLSSSIMPSPGPCNPIPVLDISSSPDLFCPVYYSSVKHFHPTICLDLPTFIHYIVLKVVEEWARLPLWNLCPDDPVQPGFLW